MDDYHRLHSLVDRPKLVRLWRAVRRLRTVVSFLNTGAHPDDETSGMLAILSFDMGVRTGFACANRGEGGQNALGREAGADLGTIRTAEMEQAALALDMTLLWLSQSPDDSIFDFRFSKSAEETLARWGKARTLERMAWAYRKFRPDCVCPTFLDVPGQHGHHRAMTRIAEEAIAIAADPKAFPEQIENGLEVWQVSKLYLPAWSGAGTSYDDTEPPPPATVSIIADRPDPVTGAWYNQLGQFSHSFHRSQGMGRWVEGEPQSWPLHLKWNFDGQPQRETTIFDDLPNNLGDLDPSLRSVQQDLDAIAKDLTNPTKIRDSAIAAYRRLDGFKITSAHRHRLARKLLELKHVIAIAGDGELAIEAEKTRIAPGEKTRIITSDSASFVTESEWQQTGDEFAAPKNSEFADPYPDFLDPLEPLGAVKVQAELAQGIDLSFDLLEPIDVLPQSSVTVSPDKAVINMTARPEFLVLKTDAAVEFAAPAGWQFNGARCQLPSELAEGLYDIAVTLDGKPAHTIKTFSYPHIPVRRRVIPASASVRVLKAELPDRTPMAYVGGGHDRVDYWLRAIGLDVTTIEHLHEVNLAQFSTLIVGILAFGNRKDLSLPALHDWVRAGGHLVTLYHRPWDGWIPTETPPARLVIGQPSLRWRVTDEHANVEHLIPDHPLLNTPNTICSDDWQGWHKERGLYFAAEWDKAYQALLRMADPGERALDGSLLSAPIGKGRHTHTSLALHTQLEALVPGAYRLMANLVASI